jgi:photosystem II stability/assembly factor-like uncharacterized protein
VGIFEAIKEERSTVINQGRITMKRIFIVLFVFASQLSFAQNSTFFNVSSSGAPTQASVTLCLDGINGMSCEKHTVTGQNLSISTNVSNRVYPSAGIKSNTPGFTPVACTAGGNAGHCLFTVSDTQPAVVGVTKHIVSIYAGMASGSIRVSNDTGATWSSTAQPGGSIGEGLYVLNSNTFFMGGINGYVQVSNDAGNSWSSMGTSPDGTPVTTVYAVDTQTLYVGTAGGSVYHSTSGGQTWRQLPPLLGYPAGVVNVSIIGSTLYATNGAGIYSSPLTNINWTAVTMPAGTTSIQTASILDANHFFAGINSYQYIDITSNGGASWTPSASYSGSTSAIYAVDQNTIYSGTEDYILYYSTNGGGSWEAMTLPDGFYINSMLTNGSKLYAGTVGGNLGISTDNGASWRLTTQPGGNFNYGLYMTPQGQMYVGGSNGSVMTSTDGGASWDTLPAYPDFQQIFSITQDGGTLYVASEDFGVMHSTNNGNSWTDTNLFGVTTTTVAVDGGVIYTNVSGEVKYSTDRGASFTATATQPDPSSSVLSLFFAGSTLYAGTASGKVAYSNDQGNTWTVLPAFTGDNSAVNTVYALNGVVYAGTQHGHVEVIMPGASAWYPTMTMPDGSSVLSLSVR